MHVKSYVRDENPWYERKTNDVFCFSSQMLFNMRNGPESDKTKYEDCVRQLFGGQGPLRYKCNTKHSEMVKGTL